ncbi:MAG: hypothetical protein NC391_09635 [Alistipes timonensis]|nr:hypothetical protein [Alistipes timonensis]
MKHIYLALALMAPAAYAADAPLALPLADSFADASFAPFWTNERVAGNFDWEAVATSPDLPKPEPYDADGGFLLYQAYRSMKGNSARLATAPIDAATATAPVLQFFMYHHTVGQDVVKAQVSADGGEWTDVEGSEVTVGGAEVGWKEYIVPLSGSIPAGASTFRVALTAVSNYGFNIVIDNVRLFNMAGKDIGVELTSAGPMVAGLDHELTLTLSNNGPVAIAPSDYKLSVAGGECLGVYPGANVEIPALGKATIPVFVNMAEAGKIHKHDEYPFGAMVEMAGDEDASNNKSFIKLPLTYCDAPVVTGVGVERLDNGYLISWNHAVDPGFTPVNISEGFEAYDEGFTGPFGGWEALDLDRKDGGSVYNAKGSALNVGVIPEGSTWRNLVRGFEGSKMLCVTVPSAAQQDDWLISPPLDASPNTTLTLAFKIGYKNFSVSQINNFEIRYTNSDGELDPAHPERLLDALYEDVRVNIPAASSGTTDPVDMQDMVYEGIPGSAKRVAIHFKSKMTSYIANAMWIDCLTLREENPRTLVSYVVNGADGCRLNSEDLPAGVNSYLLPETESNSEGGTYIYVTALYNDGESAPSEKVLLPGAQSAIEEVGADSDAPAEYYNLQGHRVSRPVAGQPVIVRRGATVSKEVR